MLYGALQFARTMTPAETTAVFSDVTGQFHLCRRCEMTQNQRYRGFAAQREPAAISW